jgi:phenylpropionate dioxygenase-like ring-hydroxylating dioxygenase large terminal subunit
VRIPSRAQIPESARVKRYPVVERYRWIWVWMGEPALADESLITDFHWLDDPAWRAKGARFHVKSSYELIIENLLDLTHLTFVHQSASSSRRPASCGWTWARSRPGAARARKRRRPSLPRAAWAAASRCAT